MRGAPRHRVKDCDKSLLPDVVGDCAATDDLSAARLTHGRGGTLSLLAVAMVLVTYFVLSRVVPWLPWHGFAKVVVGYVALSVSMVLVAVSRSGRPLLRSDQLSGGLSWSFVLGFIPSAALVCGSVTELAIKHLFTVGPTGTYNDVLPGTSASDRWLLWLVATVGAVTVEELLYRGAVLSSILHATGLPAVAIVISSVAWGLAHGGVAGGYNAAQVSGIVTAGVVAGWGCYTTRSLMPGLVAHPLHNLIASASDVRPWTTAVAVVASVGSFTMLFTFIVLLGRNIHRRRATDSG